jgi:hypothetical protein
MSHLGPALSALLDGELSPAEGAQAQAHLSDCTACRAELDRTRAVRAALRALPPVEPPAGFVTAIADPAGARRRRAGRTRASSPRLATASLVASLALSAFLVTVGAGGAPPAGPVAPLGAAVVGHGAAMAAMGADVGPSVLDGDAAGAGTAVPADLRGWRPMPASDVPAPYALPTALDGGYRLAAVYETDDGLHAVYASGDEVLSLLEMPGRLDWSSLPPDGRTMRIDGSPAWMGRSGRWTVVVVERDGIVQAAVAGDAGGPVMRAVASTPPPRPLSFGQRLRRACQQTLVDLGVLRST